MIAKGIVTAALVTVSLLGHRPEPRTIAIFVRTADGLHGVQSTVSLGEDVQVTDKEGRVVFLGLPDGKYCLRVSPIPPYKSFTWVVAVPMHDSMIFKLDKPDARPR